MKLTQKLARLTFATVVLLATVSCVRSPSTPTPTSTLTVPAAPVARLVISPDGPFPFGLADHTKLVFDASSSTGDGLTYRTSFGDGEEATQAVVTHIGRTQGRFTARVTVTDALGRTSSADADYGVISVVTRAYDVWRYGGSETTRIVRFQAHRAILGMAGSLVDFNYTPVLQVRSTTTLLGDRDISVRTDDGAIRLDGRFEWAPLWGCGPGENFGQFCVQIRMTVRGGQYDGQERLFSYYPGL